MTDVADPSGPAAREGHGGDHAVAVAAAHGVETMFTLSGAHVFPMYDAAVKGEPGMRLVDVRHEPSAVFAAEATGKLTRTPGLAVLTAGPGVTNGVSAVAQASFSGSPLVVVGGRAPTQRWGSGSLQELDQPPILAPVTKRARTIMEVGAIADGMHEAFTIASSPHRGPTFVDVPMDHVVLGVRVDDTGREPAGAGRARPRRDLVDRRAARPGRPPRAGARHGCLVGRGRGGRAASGRGDRPARDHQRHGPRRRPRRPPVARHEGAFTGVRSVRPGGRRRHAAGLPARLRVLRRQGGHRSGAGRALRGQRGPDLRPRDVGRVGVRRPLPAARRDPRGGPRCADEAGLVGLDPTAVGPGARGRDRRRRAARVRRRPDPPGPCLRRARAAARGRRGGHRGRRRLRVVRRQVRRAETAGWLARPRALRMSGRRTRCGDRRRGSLARRPRSCCCWATARPGCRSSTSTRWCGTTSRS